MFPCSHFGGTWPPCKHKTPHPPPQSPWGCLLWAQSRSAPWSQTSAVFCLLLSSGCSARSYSTPWVLHLCWYRCCWCTGTWEVTKLSHGGEAGECPPCFCFALSWVGRHGRRLACVPILTWFLVKYPFQFLLKVLLPLPSTSIGLRYKSSGGPDWEANAVVSGILNCPFHRGFTGGRPTAPVSSWARTSSSGCNICSSWVLTSLFTEPGGWRRGKDSFLLED